MSTDRRRDQFLRPATCIAQCICWPTWQFRLRRTRPTRRSLLTSTISAHTLHPTLSPASTILSAKAALQRQVARPMQEPCGQTGATPAVTAGGDSGTGTVTPPPPTTGTGVQTGGDTGTPPNLAAGGDSGGGTVTPPPSTGTGVQTGGDTGTPPILAAGVDSGGGTVTPPPPTGTGGQTVADTGTSPVTAGG